nr:MAG TPA: hypothetical protein [Bacteriophage sp.]
MPHSQRDGKSIIPFFRERINRDFGNCMPCPNNPYSR